MTVSILLVYGICLQTVRSSGFLVNVEDTFRLTDGINGHLLVGLKAAPGNDTVGLFYADKLIRIDFLFSLIPIQQLRIEAFALQVLNINVAYQFP